MMITRCPACGTMFNVVADQLKVSQGWVRCGQCSDVFDASLHLQDAQEFQEAPHNSQAVNATQSSNASSSAEVAAPASPPDEADSDDDFEQSLRAAVTASTAAKQQEKEPPSLPPAAAAQAAPAAPALKAAFAESPDKLLNEEIKAEESAAAADGVSFVQRARRQAFWGKLWVRVVLTAVATLLLIGLLLQIVLQQKDHLVLLEPQLKPALQALCGYVGCELNPLRKIDAVVIDSSTFTKQGADSYKLSFSIKNLGAVAVAMPSLEVTLTDTQDQALIRRVLSPTQFGASAALLSAGADFQGSVVLDVSNSALPRGVGSPNSRVAGYRLLAFYP